MTKVFTGIGNFFEEYLPYMEKLENLPNKFFIVVCFAAIILWVRRLAQYNKEAEQNGTLK